jgi:hypothetical protein
MLCRTDVGVWGLLYLTVSPRGTAITVVSGNYCIFLGVEQWKPNTVYAQHFGQNTLLDRGYDWPDYSGVDLLNGNDQCSTGR